MEVSSYQIHGELDLAESALKEIGADLGYWTKFRESVDRYNAWVELMAEDLVRYKQISDNLLRIGHNYGLAFLGKRSPVKYLPFSMSLFAESFEERVAALTHTNGIDSESLESMGDASELLEIQSERILKDMEVLSGTKYALP